MPAHRGVTLTLVPDRPLGGLAQEDASEELPGATWYTAHAAGEGLLYRFPAGALAGAAYLTSDFLVEGEDLAVFQLALQEGESGPTFALHYAALNQCQARLRLELAAVNQNRWQYPREGAWLKPLCYGQRVDLQKVDRLTITILRQSERPVHWCQTPLVATVEEPERLMDPLLPKGPLLDRLGQSTLHEWPGKSRSHREVTERLQAQLTAAAEQKWPADWSRWGGWAGRQLEGTGYFRTYHDGRRWWLLDPDGYLFWSAGMDCVRVNTDAAYRGLEKALAWLPGRSGEFAAALTEPYGVRHSQAVNYLAANLIRAFGPRKWYARWAEIALAELRRLGMNTVANWSDWEIARKAGTPYVRPLDGRFPHTPPVYRDFPDVFLPAFEEDAATYAGQLAETAEDPALIGYFLMNEPTWGFSQETPAAGMLLNTPTCATRLALADSLRQRYGDNAGLSAAWGVETTLAEVAQGEWKAPLGEAALRDLAAFSAVMVERFLGVLSQACRAVDPHHLNLGVRYYTLPPAWALAGMRAFDVFSMNCYRPRVPADELAQISAQLERPVLIGEWHFGALDVGLPGAGIAHVRDQAARGQAYRFYLEDAASLPCCVGVHYFTLYDESALGRFDGENWNIGFMDVCNRPYEELAAAARASHERLYHVALGEVQPYAEAPEYLAPLFL